MVRRRRVADACAFGHLSERKRFDTDIVQFGFGSGQQSLAQIAMMISGGSVFAILVRHAPPL